MAELGIRLNVGKMSANQAAHDVGRLAWDLVHGYAAHIAAIRIAPRLDHKAAVKLIADHPSDSVQHKDGTNWSFDTLTALIDLVANKTIAEELPRVWLTGSLLMLGDELKKHDYFRHAPELELVYHLRNGIAHGNQFTFTTRGLERLGKYPAHNRDAAYRHAEFVITPELDKTPVLFDFMGAADVLDLLHSVGAHLQRIARDQSS